MLRFWYINEIFLFYTTIEPIMTQKITLRMNPDHSFSMSDGRSLESLNPKEMLLYASLDCLARTITGLLKGRISTVKSMELSLEGRLSTPTVVAESTYAHFNVVYNIECHTLKEQMDISRAVNLAHDKYCGMLQMLRQIAPLSEETSIVATE